MMRKYYIFVLVFVLTAALAGLRPVSAQDTAPKPTPSDNEVNRIAKEMYCPVCENTPLDVCPTQACSEWRALIRLKLSEGWSDQQIKDYFAAQYGDRVLNEPPRRGLNWLVYILPVVFFIGGALFLYYILTRKKARAAVAQPAGQLSLDDDPYLKELEEELKKSK